MKSRKMLMHILVYGRSQHAACICVCVCLCKGGGGRKSAFVGASGPSWEGPGVGHTTALDTEQNRTEKKKKKKRGLRRKMGKRKEQGTKKREKYKLQKR